MGSKLFLCHIEGARPDSTCAVKIKSTQKKCTQKKKADEQVLFFGEGEQTRPNTGSRQYWLNQIKEDNNKSAENGHIG